MWSEAATWETTQNIGVKRMLPSLYVRQLTVRLFSGLLERG